MASEIETCSLEGVPGIFIDATLGFRDGSFVAGPVASRGVETVAEDGVSGFGAGTTRRVFGAVLMTGDDMLPPGDSGFDVADGVCATLRWPVLLDVIDPVGVADVAI